MNLEYLKQHWKFASVVLTVAAAIVTLFVSVRLEVFRLEDGHEDLERLIVAKWDEDKVFNKQWQGQDQTDETTLQRLLNDVKDGHTDIKVGIAQIRGSDTSLLLGLVMGAEHITCQPSPDGASVHCAQRDE